MSTKTYRSRTRPETTEPPTSELVFLTVNETAAFLRLSPVTLGRWRIEAAVALTENLAAASSMHTAISQPGHQAQRRSSTSYEQQA